MPELPQFEASPQPVSDTLGRGIAQWEQAARERMTLGYRIRSEADSAGAALGHSFALQGKEPNQDPNGFQEMKQVTALTTKFSQAQLDLQTKINAVQNDPANMNKADPVGALMSDPKTLQPFAEIEQSLQGAPKGVVSHYMQLYDRMIDNIRNQRTNGQAIRAGAAAAVNDAQSVNSFGAIAAANPGGTGDAIQNYHDTVTASVGALKGELSVGKGEHIDEHFMAGAQKIAAQGAASMLQHLTGVPKDENGNPMFGADPDSAGPRAVWQKWANKYAEFLPNRAELDKQYEEGVKAWHVAQRAQAAEQEKVKLQQFDQATAGAVTVQGGNVRVSPTAVPDAIATANQLGIPLEKVRTHIEALKSIQEYPENAPSDPQTYGWLQERLIKGTLTVNTLNEMAATGKLSPKDYNTLNARIKAVAEDPATKDFMKQFDDFAKNNAPAQTRDDVGVTTLPGAKIANYQWKRDTLAIAQQMFDKGIPAADIFDPKGQHYIGKLAPEGSQYVKAAQEAVSAKDAKFYNPQFRDPSLTPEEFLRRHSGGRSGPQP